MRPSSSVPVALCLALVAVLAALPSTSVGSRALNANSQGNNIIRGTVKDQTGAVVPNASVTVRDETSGAVKTATTNNEGRFEVTGIAAGRYRVSVTRNGFKPIEQVITVEADKPALIDISLAVAETRSEVTVAGKGAITPNSEKNYRALRDAKPETSFSVSGLVLKRDAGDITLRSGSVTFLTPVLDRVAAAVFVGEGDFTLTPALPMEKDYMKFMTGKDTLAESFNRMVLFFTDETAAEIKKGGTATQLEPRALEVLREFQKRARRSTERPQSFIHYLLNGEEMENIDGEVLGSLFNPNRRGAFNAYIFGKKYQDLRYHIRPDGVFPNLPSPEEVALVNLDPQGKEEGILYLSHFADEYRKGTASSEEDKRIIDAEHYKIETVIRGEKLTASAELTFKALADGDRLIRFGLLPHLRVSRVAFNGKDIDYIQEKRQEDGAFYAILPEATAKGRQYKLTIEYQGDQVVSDAGGGNFAVGARTSWYPSVNAFTDRATFDLTFKIPNKFILVSVGKMVKEGKEGDSSVSQWVSDVPLAVAGFNYGLFKRKELTDETTKYLIEGYATTELPDYLKGAEQIGGMSPARLIDKGMNEAQNSMRVFTHWFGPAPYGRIAITQQPQMNFGQSWPSLVYLPIISFFDSTQRWQLFGVNSGLSDFIQEVTPHEVAHQWWGHIVGWSSFHDQWLSEGFSDFSASLFLQATNQTPDRYLKFWEQQKKSILEKNQYGHRPNDVGPLWTGLRLNTARSPGAYSRIVYPKGSYVLHMLRWMMYDRKTGDQRFIAMMRDFVQTNFNKNVSTEGFKAMVEKHMTDVMDLDGNKRMDWFFRQFVYGTEVPRYKLDYALVPQSDGTVMLTGTLTQSEVSPEFKMLVPLYLDFDGKMLRVGEFRITGSTTIPEFQVKLPQKPRRVVINYHHDVLATESLSVGK